MKDDYEPLGSTEEFIGDDHGAGGGITGDDQGLDYLGSEFTGP